MGLFRKLAVVAPVFSALTSTLVRAEGTAEDAEDLDAPETVAVEEEAEEKAGAVIITDGNFKDILKKNEDKALFIKFYAPWCGHCKRMAPLWEELAAEVAGTECVIAKLDATSDKASKTGSEFEIRGFPTLKLVKGDKMYDYEGGRGKEELKKFCTGGYSSATSSSLPWNQTFVDKAKKWVSEFITKLGQVHNFEPVLLPATFLSGCGLGLMLGLLVSSMAGSSVDEEEVAKEIAAAKKGTKAE